MLYVELCRTIFLDKYSIYKLVLYPGFCLHIKYLAKGFFEGLYDGDGDKHQTQ